MTPLHPQPWQGLQAVLPTHTWYTQGWPYMEARGVILGAQGAQG